MDRENSPKRNTSTEEARCENLDYIKRLNVEELIKKTIRCLLRDKPNDPVAYICKLYEWIKIDPSNHGSFMEKSKRKRRQGTSEETPCQQYFHYSRRPSRIMKKDKNTLERLENCLKKVALLKDITEAEKNDIFDAMVEKQTPMGKTVIREGDLPDFFYVVDEGELTVFVDGKKVQTLTPGGYFGDLALINNTTRAATVNTVTDVKLFALDRHTFRKIVLSYATSQRDKFDTFLSKVDIMKGMTQYERLNAADALVLAEYSDGEVIISEGEIGHNLYLIMDGEAEVYRSVVNNGLTCEEKVEVLSTSSHFGEYALTSQSHKQTETVMARGTLKVAKLNRATFERLFGPAKRQATQRD